MDPSTGRPRKLHAQKLSHQPPPQMPPQQPIYDPYAAYGGYSYPPDQGYQVYGGGPQLFEDLSQMNYAPQGMQQMPPQQQMGQGMYGGFPTQLLNDPLANVAMQYGQNLVGQSREIVDQKLEKYVSISRLKYFFAVDNAYVMKKLQMLFFPFTNTDWSIKYNLDEPIAPRDEVNAADLYIPLMAFCTYILMAGIVLGLQSRFGPEQLGILASSALGWLAVEVMILVTVFYVCNVNSKLSTYHLAAFLSYKYVGMVGCLGFFLILQSVGYYGFLVYFSISLAYFLIRAMKAYMPTATATDSFSGGIKRRNYIVLAVAVVQPLFMLYLTSYLTVRFSPPIQNPII